MNGINPVVNAVLWIVFLLFSGTIHELCHAVAADHQGDPTPRNQGRLTLNPIPHIDPMWTIILPGAMLLISNGSFAFGGAKPVSMNPLNFRNPELGFTIAAALGPISNFVLAGIAVLGGLLYTPAQADLVLYSMALFYFINILLGVFNLIPIPPLDGSRILRYLLPGDKKKLMDQIEQFGIIIVMVVVFFTPLLSIVLNPFIRFGVDMFGYEVWAMMGW